ncbi:MAG TPA: flagellar basal body L-ring protein FlgH [Vulgatibacter sp.]|nr:flagellar basal body L-ring protein FlgH [Vulgatibacter sp.]
MRPSLAFAALAIVATACGPAHVSNYTPKRRTYELPEEPDPKETAATPGSLWRENRPLANLFTDARALRVNDLVVVKVEEVADAKRSADTDLNRSSESAAAITAFLGAIEQLEKNSNIRPLLAGSSSANFRGDGSTSRTERFTATVSAMVRKVFPNGNLFIEGHRVVLVNNEEQHFYISGVVRPIDIDQENSVKSSKIADAEIEFTGRGVLTDNQQQGWLSRYLGWIWPF